MGALLKFKTFQIPELLSILIIILLVIQIPAINAVENTNRLNATPEITIISPNGGEVWRQGQVRNIKWEYTGNPGPGSNIKIELILGFSGVVETITNPTLYEEETLFRFSVEYEYSPSDIYWVRITSLSDPSLWDVSDDYFSIEKGPTFNFIKPGGGETWFKGMTYNIIWETTNAPADNVSLIVFDGEWKDVNIGSNIENNDIYAWTIPKNLENRSDYRIAISAPFGRDYITNYFIITDGPARITSPTVGTEWELGQQYTISWEIDNLPGYYANIKLFKNNSFKQLIYSFKTGIQSNGSTTWTVPSDIEVGTDYKIRLTLSTFAGLFYSTQNNIIIKTPSWITVTSPNGGESWKVGSNHDITWDSEGTEVVKLHYSIDGGNNWTSIINIQDNVEYSWTIPNKISTECLIRVSDADGGPIDISDHLFSIIKNDSSPPMADFGCQNKTGEKPFQTQFNDNSTGTITDWLWDFGDGNTNTNKNPMHTYTDAGEYTVSLKVTGPGGSDTKIRTNYIQVVDPTLIKNDKESIPATCKLYQNYPNPFNPNTTIKYNVQEPSHVLLELYNIKGQKIQTIKNSFHLAGFYQVELDMQNSATGLYFYKIIMGNFQDIKKMYKIE